MEGDVIEVFFANAVAFGAFFGEREPDPCGDDEQDHVAGRGEEVTKEGWHIIVGSVRRAYEAGLQTLGRR